MENTVLFKKVYGCLAGGALGDAMGAPSESSHYEDIQSRGGVTTLLEGQWFTGASRRAGKWTDDTELRHLLCEAIIKANGKVTSLDVAAVWLEDYRVSGDRFWLTEQIAIRKLLDTRNKPSARDVGNLNIICDDAAMMIAPIGIINACNPKQASIDAFDVASICQWSYGREAACAVAAAVAEAMNLNSTVDSVINASVSYVSQKVSDAILAAVRLAQYTNHLADFTKLYYEKLLCEKEYDPLEVVPCALAFFYFAGGDPLKTIIGSANFGRDCDTIATIGGAVAGAFKGIDKIPMELVNIVQEANQFDLKKLAQKMVEVIKANIEQAEKQLEYIREMM